MGLAQGRERLPRTVRLLVVARAVNRLGAFSLSFLAVLLTTRFGASTAVAGCVSAAFGLATIPSRLAGGRLADRIGRRRTIVVGLAGCAAAQLGIAAAGGLASAVCFAVLLGLAYEIYEPPSQAMIADVVAPAERVRAYGLLNAALAAGGMGAGLLAATLGHWDLRWLFVADAVSCLLCALTVRLVLPADRPHAARTANDGPAADGAEGPDGAAVPSTPATPATPWRDRTLLLMLGAGTLFAVLYLQIMMTLPLSLGLRGLRPADAGLLFTVSALTIAAGQPLARLSRLTALPPAAAFAVGYVLMALGLAGYAVAPGMGGYVAATVVWSVGDLLLVGRAFAFVAGLAPAGGTGRYLAVYGTSWGIGAIVAPLAGTQLLDRAGAAGLWSTMAAVCLLLAVVQPALVSSAGGDRARGRARRAPAGPRPTGREPALRAGHARRPDVGENA